MSLTESDFRSFVIEAFTDWKGTSPFVLKTRLADVTTNSRHLVDHWWNLVARSYAEPQRHYHTMAHVESMWSQLEAHLADPGPGGSVAQATSSPQGDGQAEGDTCLSDLDVTAIRLAILFHDIVYDPSRNDNELKSIEVFRSFASDFHLADSLADMVVGFIRATIEHALPDPSFPASLPLFLDLDLEVLSRPTQAYQLYSRQISMEYRPHMPLPQYLEGRVDVLQKLSQGDIYFTRKWKQGHSEAAKQNMLEEINDLAQQLDRLKSPDKDDFVIAQN